MLTVVRGAPEREIAASIGADARAVGDNLAWWLADPEINRTVLAARLDFAVDLLHRMLVPVLGREPSCARTAEILGVSSDQVRRALDRLTDTGDVPPEMPASSGLRHLRLVASSGAA